MSFAIHSLACGVLVTDLSPSNRIRRCGTVTHPASKNGAYLWDGKSGWAWNWEDGEVQPYGDKREFTAKEKAKWIASKREADKQLARKHENAALRAAILLRDAPLATHAYLSNKGFPDMVGHVDEEGKLLIPMRSCADYEIVGLQAVMWLPDDRKFSKKMLGGMKAKGAIHRLGSGRARKRILVEGYATALSASAAVRQLCLDAAVVACFSDSNMVHVAERLGEGSYIFADNDESKAGEAAAIKAGLPWVMSDVAGEDANDLHQRAGLFALCQKVMELVRK